MGLFEKLTANAKAKRQRIVLPEGTEPVLSQLLTES